MRCQPGKVAQLPPTLPQRFTPEPGDDPHHIHGRGCECVKRQRPTSGTNTIDLVPANSAQQQIRNTRQYLTSRRAPISPPAVMAKGNPGMTGWVNDCRHTNASQAFRGLQRFVNLRFRRYLPPSSQGRGVGWKRSPNRKL